MTSNEVVRKHAQEGKSRENSHHTLPIVGSCQNVDVTYERSVTDPNGQPRRLIASFSYYVLICCNRLRDPRPRDPRTAFYALVIGP